MRRGFSLIELLVVISVIALLAAMLVPAIRLVRESARTTKCKANLRQIVLGIHGYAQDWEAKLVPHYNGNGIRWFANLAEYLDAKRTGADWQVQGDLMKFNSVFWGCPVYNTDMAKKGASDYDWRPGYGLAKQPLLPASTWETNWATPVDLTKIRDIYLHELTHQSQRLLSTETIDWYTEASWSGGKAIWPNPKSAFSRGDVIRHTGRANYGFVDGHVSTLLPTTSGLAYLDPAKFSE